MARWRRLAVAAVVAVGLVSGGAAWAGAPTDQLRGRVERVIQVLEDPELRQEARTAERRAALRAIAYEIFDFRALSQRALARHWQGRTEAERQEFVRLFADLLERSYVDKIETYSSGDRVQYTSEVIDGGQATVRTRIVTKSGAEIPIDYRMHRVGDRWLVFDVAIEGVSLVANYRAQFNRIIQTSSFQSLMDRLRARTGEGLQSDAASPGRASQR
jgi:phospholipid transport system substrate-binding protein